MAAAQVDLLKQKEESSLEKLSNKIIQQLNTEYRIKPKQFQAIENVVNGKDTLAILPTSYGKSVIYQLLPSLFRELKIAANYCCFTTKSLNKKPIG